VYYSIRLGFRVFPKWNRWLFAHPNIGFANSTCNVHQQLCSGTGPRKNPCYAVENQWFWFSLGKKLQEKNFWCKAFQNP